MHLVDRKFVTTNPFKPGTAKIPTSLHIACWKRTGLLKNMLYLISLEKGLSPASSVHHEEANAQAVLQCLTLYLHPDFPRRFCGSFKLDLEGLV